MILDSLENSKRIECIHPLFKQAFDYVKSTDFSKMEDGKYEIADAGFTVSIASRDPQEIYRYPIPLIGRRENRMETGRSITRGVRSIQRGARYRLLYRQTYRLYENLSRTIRHLFPGRRARPGYRPREYPEGGYQDPGPIVSNTLFVPQE